MGPPGMVVPYEVKTSNATGRGVYATRDVKEGEMIWYNSRVIQFKTEAHYRGFLNCLPDYDIRRSAVMWSWEEDHDDSFLVKIALDVGSLVNHAKNPNSGTHPRCDKLIDDFEQKCYQNNYALTDIPAGTEFTDNYDSYDISLKESGEVDDDEEDTWMDGIEKEYAIHEYTMIHGKKKHRRRRRRRRKNRKHI